MQAQIDWAAADVKDATLVAPLTGKPSQEWADRLGEIVARLDRTDRLGSVKVTPKRVQVEGVQPGTESEVRHLLDGAVLQVNSDFAPAVADDETGDKRSEEDRSMADAFRAFAGDEPDDSRGA